VPEREEQMTVRGRAVRLSRRAAVLCALLALSGACRSPRLVPDGSRPEASALSRALALAGPNRAAIEIALATVEPARWRSLAFLVENMPVEDVRSLDARYLLEDVELAHEVFASAPWAERTPEEVFLEAVLPYACASEPREPWRRRLHEALSPVVAGARTTSEAAQRLNETVWKRFGVSYSPKRLRPDQSPAQSIALGTASCTGLSIFLCLACRSVGIPSRVVGLDAWPHKPGNHTWVEIFDGGRWRCVGAAEPEHPVGSGWFIQEAGLARREEPRHAIWAVSFRRTGVRLPLSWAAGTTLDGMNVTDAYAPRPDVVAPDR